MKAKIIAITLALIIAFSLFSACNLDTEDETTTTTETTTTGETQTTIEGTTNDSTNSESEITALMAELVDSSISEIDILKDMSYVINEITDENMEYNLGKAGLPIEEGLALEPEMGGGFSVCIVKIEDDADIDDVKKSIKDNVNPMKWVCMGVAPSNVLVDNVGDYIILVMSDNSPQEIVDAFKNLDF